jgi:hypothetical protein
MRVKIDLHIDTLDDPKNTLGCSAHELLERARVCVSRSDERVEA